MKKNYNAPLTTVAISKNIHEELVSFIEEKGIKIGKFVENAIKEKIDAQKRNKE